MLCSDLDRYLEIHLDGRLGRSRLLLRLRDGHDGLPIEHGPRDRARGEVLLRLDARHEHEAYEVLFVERRVGLEEVVAVVGFGEGA